MKKIAVSTIAICLCICATYCTWAFTPVTGIFSLLTFSGKSVYTCSDSDCSTTLISGNKQVACLLFYNIINTSFFKTAIGCSRIASGITAMGEGKGQQAVYICTSAFSGKSRDA